MNILYTTLIYIAQFTLKFVALFNKKINLFVEGRNETFQKLTASISKKDQVIWVHCASLGEFEQGRPVLEKLKEKHPSKKIVITFFSPSGYEIRKKYALADVVCYLPFDTPSNVSKFLEIVHPKIAIIVKYEFWPNLLKGLKEQHVKTILISGIFRKNQSFFKWYGSYMRKALKTFDFFFVQDENSKALLNSIHFKNVEVSGDTRFDRVFEITQQNNKLDFIAEFKNNTYTLVAGSTWKEDETLLVDYINNKATENEKFIIAPHNINVEEIQLLKKSIQKKTILYSEKETKNLSEYQVFIIDTVGILTKIYSYADIAYVGGGYTKSGVHNVLEPATFGVPIVIGPNYYKFKEATELVNGNACFVVDDSQKLTVLLESYYLNEKMRLDTGQKARNYVKSNIGATTKILNYLK